MCVHATIVGDTKRTLTMVTVILLESVVFGSLRPWYRLGGCFFCVVVLVGPILGDCSFWIAESDARAGGSNAVEGEAPHGALDSVRPQFVIRMTSSYLKTGKFRKCYEVNLIFTNFWPVIELVIIRTRIDRTSNEVTFVLKEIYFHLYLIKY